MANRKSTIMQKSSVLSYAREFTYEEPEKVVLPPMEQKKGWLPGKFKGMLAEREATPKGDPLEIRKGNVIRRPAMRRLFTSA